MSVIEAADAPVLRKMNCACPEGQAITSTSSCSAPVWQFWAALLVRQSKVNISACAAEPSPAAATTTMDAKARETFFMGRTAVDGERQATVGLSYECGVTETLSRYRTFQRERFHSTCRVYVTACVMSGRMPPKFIVCVPRLKGFSMM